MWVSTSIIAATCIAVYFSILSVGFLSDDWVIISKIRHGSITDIGAEGIFFRPLTVISFAIDLSVFGKWAMGFHIVNLLMHVVASLGVAACATLIVRRPYAGLIAGVVFAIHPAHPEAVTWIAGRYDVLCGMFLAWSFFLYLKSYESGVGNPGVLRGLSLGLFMLAILSKEMAYGFPLVILLCELLPVGNIGNPPRPLRTRVMHITSFFIVAVLMLGLRWLRMQGFGASDYLPKEMGGILNAEMLYRVFLEPLLYLFLPLNRFILTPTTSFAVILIEAVLLLPLALLALKRRMRVVAFCAAAIVISFLPTAHMGIEKWAFMSSRFLYTPSIFFSILIAALFVDIDKRYSKKRFVVITLAVYFAAMLLLIYQNNHPWRIAGQVTRTSLASSAQLIEQHSGEWGTSRRKLVVANVPRAVMGAYLYLWGLPEMLYLYHGSELDGVQIEVIFEEPDTKEMFTLMNRALVEGDVVWLLDYETSEFVEYKPRPE